MSKVNGPATPDDELAKYKAAGQQSRYGILTADLAALAQGGVNIALASCGTDGRPIAGRGLGARIEADGWLRVLLPRRMNLGVLHAVEAGGAISVTFSRPADHRSFQVKAGGALVCPARPDDMPELARQCAVFRDALIAVREPRRVVEGFSHYDPDDVVAIEFLPDEAFVQTPGPGAGSPLLP